MNSQLLDLLHKNLPKEWIEESLAKKGEAGEELAVDEAAVWKRILDYRVVQYAKPKKILETHAGLYIASELYKLASQDSDVLSCTHYQTDIPTDKKFDYIDVDPFGQPYDALSYCKERKVASKNCIWAITNGEIMQICRNLKGATLASEWHGKDCWKWVEQTYIPYIEEALNTKIQFYYIFPSSVRCIFSNAELPKGLWKDCPKYMSWIAKYAGNSSKKRRLF